MTGVKLVRGFESLPSRHPNERLGGWWSLPGRLRQHYRQTAAERPSEDVAMRIFATFLATFALVRLVTHGIRGGWLPLRNVVLGGRGGRNGAAPLHVHHLVLGIVGLTGSGYAALLRADHQARRRVAPAFGAAAALTFDEFALWLHLRDDYWSREGRSSVDVAVGLAATFGVFAGSPVFWGRALGEVAATAAACRGAVARAPTDALSHPTRRRPPWALRADGG